MRLARRWAASLLTSSAPEEPVSENSSSSRAMYPKQRPSIPRRPTSMLARTPNAFPSRAIERCSAVSLSRFSIMPASPVNTVPIAAIDSTLLAMKRRAAASSMRAIGTIDCTQSSCTQSTTADVRLRMLSTSAASSSNCVATVRMSSPVDPRHDSSNSPARLIAERALSMLGWP